MSDNGPENLFSREREILRMLTRFSEKDLEFVVVGGYAVATVIHRFSVDLDLVVREQGMSKFETLLKDNGYSLTYSKAISQVYREGFKRFEKRLEGLPVDVDLLVNGLVSRTTHAVWGFDYIIKESMRSGIECVKFLVPGKELLLAMKLHSGRLSDMRDVVALFDGANIEVMKKHALRGDKEKLRQILIKGMGFLRSPNFSDSFKGVFGSRFYKKESVEKSIEVLAEMVEALKE